MDNAQYAWVETGYAGLPFGDFSQLRAGGVGVLGVPSEVARGPRFGTALAPDALRRLSKQVEMKLPLDGRDLGNLSLTEDWSAKLVQMVLEMGKSRVCSVVLGGETDVALSVLSAFPEAPLVAAVPGLSLPLTQRSADTVVLGLNGDQPAEVWGQMDPRRLLWRTARQLDEGRADALPVLDRAVLWIDMSVLDLGHAAGAIGLNPGGLKPETLVAVIEQMAGAWQSIVITGLAPRLDTRGLSELAAIEAIQGALRDG